MIIKAAYGFYYKGVTKVTYNHYSGNPNGLGKVIMFQLNDLSLDVIKNRFEDIKMIKDYTRLVYDETILNELAIYQDKNSPLPANCWYSLLLKAQGSIKPYFDDFHPLNYMMDFNNFLYHSEHCEYAYIINLDTEMFEIHKGNNKNFKAVGRYVTLDTPEFLNGSYAGVRLLSEIPLDYLFKSNKEQLMNFIKNIEMIEEF